MKGDRLIGIVLIVVLGYYCWKLSKGAWITHRQPSTEQTIVSNNQRLGFQFEAGIDVFGKPVYPLPPPKAERTIIFLLRGVSMKEDLDFWRQANSVLPKDPGLRLVGYCDSIICTDFIRNNAAPISFPVIAYGEVAASQAVVNADIQGNAILRSERWFLPKQVAWRTSGRTAQSVIQEALQ